MICEMILGKSANPLSHALSVQGSNKVICPLPGIYRVCRNVSSGEMVMGFGGDHEDLLTQ